MRTISKLRRRSALGLAALAGAALAVGIGTVTVPAAQASPAASCPEGAVCWFQHSHWGGARYSFPSANVFGQRNLPDYMQNQVSSSWNNSSRAVCTYQNEPSGTVTIINRDRPGSGEDWYAANNDAADFWAPSDHRVIRPTAPKDAACRR